VWLRALQATGPKITGNDLIAAWLRHLAPAHAEYACARANFRRDLPPPVCGAFDNPSREALGALARADLWGMLAPGDPEQAACHARGDAMLDHAGAGIDAAITIAALASAAFVESDIRRLVEVSLSLIQEDSKVARAARDTVRWHGELAHWRRTREMLLRAYGSEDVRDGTIAVCLAVLSLLHGKGEFGPALLTAARCGWSTAATCAATGVIQGILLGADGIPPEWRAATRGEMTTGWGALGLPITVQSASLAAQTREMGRLVIRSECSGRVQLAEEREEQPAALTAPEAPELPRQLAMGPYVVSYRRGPLQVEIDYDERPTVGYDAPRRLVVALTNVATRSLEVHARLSAPAGFIATSSSGPMTLAEGTTVSFTVTVSAPKERARIAAVNPCTLFLSVDDGTEATVPITYVGEALWFAAGPYGEFDEAHAPEQPGILSGETPLGPDGWQSLSVVEPSVNVLTGFEGEQGTYYLATDLLVRRRGRARLRVGCNDGTKTWLNGQEVFFQHEHRAVSPLSADEFEVELRQGWNRLMIKVAQCSPRRFLSVIPKDQQGHMLLDAANTSPRVAP
jgi:hypothetical protein